MRLIMCVMAAMAITLFAAEARAQTGPAAASPGDDMKRQVSEAFTKSKRLTVHVSNPYPLSGVRLKNDEATGVVKSANDTCFQFEYKDGSKHLHSDCIAYTQATVVKWQTKLLRTLGVIGETSAIVGAGLIIIPLMIVLAIPAAILGHSIADC